MMTELPWKPAVYLPANLTVSLRDPLQLDDSLSWCTAKAAELLGPPSGSRQEKKLAQCLAKYVTHFSKQRPLIAAALFFYPDFGHLPPWGTAKVEAFAEHSEGEASLTIARMREFYEQPDELSFGQTELNETRVPIGPALRVHRHRRTEPAKRRSSIGEELVWLIWPPESTVVITIAVRWLEATFSEAGIKIADDMARNFRVEPRSFRHRGRRSRN
jgi:hypothetical protein